MDREISRRQFVKMAGVIAGAGVAAGAGMVRPRWSFAQIPAVPTNLELVTVTDSSFALTWFTGDPTSLDEYRRPAPVPSDTVLYYGSDPNPLNWQKVVVEEETPYHYVEIEGLEPGTSYYFRAESGGIPAAPVSGLPEPAAAGILQTLTPPSGRHLYTIAWMNDLHFGETVSGLATSDPMEFPPGFHVDPADPYWRFMGRGALADMRERGAELLLVGGDLTAEAEPDDVREVRTTLDTFGAYRRNYFVARGNHDRAHGGGSEGDPGYATCHAKAGDKYDCMADCFFPDGKSFFSTDYRGLHIVGLDSADIQSGSGVLSHYGQTEWLKADLEAHASTPTIIFFHHPVTEMASATAAPPVVFTVNQTDAQAFMEMVAGTSVIAVYHGHTHRNWVTTSPTTGSLPYIEVGATKEYPGGYALVKVYEGGLMVNFYKTRSAKARAWSERSRGEYLGLYPYYTLGRLSDRNLVIPSAFPVKDTGRPSPATDVAGRTGSRLPATGSALAGAGALLVAGGAAARALSPRPRGA
ncbi:MAG: metallophosphoesterase [Actinomycetota bacterium]